MMIPVDHVYCINMDMCWDRWNRMCERFQTLTDRHGKGIDRFSAITWADPRIYDQRRRQPEKRAGILGCTQSHRDLWERIAKSSELVLILEDDVFFQRDFTTILNQDLTRLADQIRRGPFIYFVNGSGCGDNIKLDYTDGTGLCSSSRETGPVYLTGGYVVNAAACRELIAIADANPGIAADHVTWTFQARFGGLFEKSCSFFHWPWLAMQENTESYIQTENHLQEQVQHNEQECLTKHGHLYPEYGLIGSTLPLQQKTLTLVTMFYDLAKVENNSQRRQKSDYLKWADFVLSLPVNLVIFTEPDLEEHFQKRRATSTCQTLVCARKFQELSQVKRYLSVASVNWKSNIPYYSQKHTAPYGMAVSSKPALVREIAELNPFGTTHFGWIDIGCGHIAGVDANARAQITGGKTFTLLDRDVIFAPRMHTLPNRIDDYPAKQACYEMLNHVLGGFYTATRRAAIDFSSAYDESIRELIISKRLCPTDEAVLTWTAILFPEMFHLYQTTWPTIISDAFHSPLIIPRFNNTIVILVTSCWKYLPQRLPVIEETWARCARARGFKVFYLVGGGKKDDGNDMDNVLTLSCPDTYEGLPQKIVCAFAHVQQNIPDYSHIVKVDDDVFVNVANLAKRIDSVTMLWSDCYAGEQIVNANPNWHFGKCTDSVKNQTAYQGSRDSCWASGGGYILSKDLVQIIVDDAGPGGSNIPEIEIYEDKYVGEVMLKHGKKLLAQKNWIIDYTGRPQDLHDTAHVLIHLDNQSGDQRVGENMRKCAENTAQCNQWLNKI